MAADHLLRGKRQLLALHMTVGEDGKDHLNTRGKRAHVMNSSNYWNTLTRKRAASASGACRRESDRVRPEVTYSETATRSGGDSSRAAVRHMRTT